METILISLAVVLCFLINLKSNSNLIIVFQTIFLPYLAFSVYARYLIEIDSSNYDLSWYLFNIFIYSSLLIFALSYQINLSVKTFKNNVYFYRHKSINTLNVLLVILIFISYVFRFLYTKEFNIFIDYSSYTSISSKLLKYIRTFEIAFTYIWGSVFCLSINQYIQNKKSDFKNVLTTFFYIINIFFMSLLSYSSNEKDQFLIIIISLLLCLNSQTNKIIYKNFKYKIFHSFFKTSLSIIGSFLVILIIGLLSTIRGGTFDILGVINNINEFIAPLKGYFLIESLNFSFLQKISFAFNDLIINLFPFNIFDIKGDTLSVIAAKEYYGVNYKPGMGNGFSAFTQPMAYFSDLSIIFSFIIIFYLNCLIPAFRSLAKTIFMNNPILIIGYEICILKSIFNIPRGGINELKNLPNHLLTFSLIYLTLILLTFLIKSFLNDTNYSFKSNK